MTFTSAHLAAFSCLLHGLTLSALRNRTTLAATLHYAVVTGARGAIVHTPFLFVGVSLVVLFAHKAGDNSCKGINWKTSGFSAGLFKNCGGRGILDPSFESLAEAC